MKTIKESLIFSLGILGLILSGFWYLKEGGYEPIISFLGSIAVLASDFLFSSDGFSQKSLESKKIGELRKIARSLNVARPNSMSKKRLLQEISKAKKPKYNFAYRWNSLKWILFVGSIILIPILDCLILVKGELPPNLAIAWYKSTDSGLELVNPNDIQIFLDPEEVIKNRLRMPIQIAVSNRENSSLKVVRIELSYSKNLQVFSEGKARIDPNSNLLIYEHEIGTLENVGHFTPLEQVDTIFIPFQFFVDGFITLLKDDIPIYMTTIVGESFFEDRTIRLGIRVYCEDRPTINTLIRIHIDADFNSVFDTQNGVDSELSNKDFELFSSSFPASIIVNQWQQKIKPPGKLVEYKMIHYPSGDFQLVSVDHILRRLVADTNKDGNMDFILLNNDDDVEPDIKLIFPEPLPMRDWEKEAAK